MCSHGTACCTVAPTPTFQDYLPTAEVWDTARSSLVAREQEHFDFIRESMKKFDDRGLHEIQLIGRHGERLTMAVFSVRDGRCHLEWGYLPTIIYSEFRVEGKLWKMARDTAEMTAWFIRTGGVLYPPSSAFTVVSVQLKERTGCSSCHD